MLLKVSQYFVGLSSFGETKSKFGVKI